MFNKYVKEQRTNLQACGGKTEDLLTNLWKAYLLALDKTFVQYTQNKKDNCRKTYCFEVVNTPFLLKAKSYSRSTDRLEK